VETKLRFFRQIAHEFRTPLTLIFGAVDQLRQQDGPTNTTQHLDRLEQQAGHLMRQVDEIMELAKLQADTLTLRPLTADFVRHQRLLLESFRSLAEEQAITLSFRSDVELMWLAFDPDYWRKITSNLVSNALKFTPKGGRIELQLHWRKQAEGLILHYALSDTGQGIAPTFLSLLPKMTLVVAVVLAWRSLRLW